MCRVKMGLSRMTDAAATEHSPSNERAEPRDAAGVAPPSSDAERVPYAVPEMGHCPPGTVPAWFTTRDKIVRLLWTIVQATIFRYSPKRWDGYRAWLLRRFGATIHGRPMILRSTVKIEVPWNITLGDNVQIGDDVRLYSLARITIGAHSIVSQYSHVCAGTHDHTDTVFPLRRVPITIGEHVWLGTDVYVAPGVTIGDGVVVGARSNVFKDLPAWKICVGSPAKPVKDRLLLNTATGERLDPHA